MWHSRYLIRFKCALNRTELLLASISRISLYVYWIYIVAQILCTLCRIILIMYLLIYYTFQVNGDNRINSITLLAFLISSVLSILCVSFTDSSGRTWTTAITEGLSSNNGGSLQWTSFLRRRIIRWTQSKNYWQSGGHRNVTLSIQFIYYLKTI